MKILHIETSSKNCSVAISSDEKLLCLCEKVSQDYKQSENLHTYIEWALEGAEIKLKDLDAVSLGKGPGSYTGLRIGAASAKGFCFGLGIPLVTVNSLETMVEPFLGDYDLVIQELMPPKLDLPLTTPNFSQPINGAYSTITAFTSGTADNPSVVKKVEKVSKTVKKNKKGGNNRQP